MSKSTRGEEGQTVRNDIPRVASLRGFEFPNIVIGRVPKSVSVVGFTWAIGLPGALDANERVGMWGIEALADTWSFIMSQTGLCLKESP